MLLAPPLHVTFAVGRAEPLGPLPDVSASVPPPAGTGQFLLDLCSGATRPLSQAAFRNELACFSVDILLDTSHDLLQDVFYESMLRWCFSGLFLFALAGPPCGDFSRAKLRPGGPKPLRTPEFPFGVPGLSDRGQLAETAAVCSVVPACCFGLNIHKKWLFASSLQDMSQLAGECNHASWEHENLVGKRDDWGGSRTQQSAVYPDGLCETIVQIIRPLFPRCEPLLNASVAYLSDCVPKKGASDPPHSFQDGAGIYSVPDWSVPPATARPLPGNLRQSLLQWLSERRVPIRLQHHVRSCEDSPLFTTDEVVEITSVDWSVPPGQPYCLHALQCLSECLGDRDMSLWHCLLQGIDQGYLEEIDSLAHAQQRWGDRVAVGRVNVVQAPGKAPRLVVDSSVSATNDACYVPESYQLPLLESIRFSSPLRECSSVMGGFSLDIRAARKTVRVRERDRGLLGVGLQDGDSYRFFFYKVCPFGATFSSHWFQRVSGFLVRFLHVLIWVRRMLMMYSDDLLMAQDEAVLPLMASLVLAACAVFGYPISWKKLQLGPTVTWIGWELHFSSGSFCIPQDKLLRLEEMLQTLLRERHVKRKISRRLLVLSNGCFSAIQFFVPS